MTFRLEGLTFAQHLRLIYLPAKHQVPLTAGVPRPTLTAPLRTFLCCSLSEQTRGDLGPLHSCASSCGNRCPTWSIVTDIGEEAGGM